MRKGGGKGGSDLTGPEGADKHGGVVDVGNHSEGSLSGFFNK